MVRFTIIICPEGLLLRPQHPCKTVMAGIKVSFSELLEPGLYFPLIINRIRKRQKTATFLLIYPFRRPFDGLIVKSRHVTSFTGSTSKKQNNLELPMQPELVNVSLSLVINTQL